MQDRGDFCHRHSRSWDTHPCAPEACRREFLIPPGRVQSNLPPARLRVPQLLAFSFPPCDSLVLWRQSSLHASALTQAALPGSYTYPILASSLTYLSELQLMGEKPSRPDLPGSLLPRKTSLCSPTEKRLDQAGEQGSGVGKELATYVQFLESAPLIAQRPAFSCTTRISGTRTWPESWTAWAELLPTAWGNGARLFKT